MHAFDTETNKHCSSRTVLTGSLGTIALTDPTDWVRMRIKTLSLLVFQFFHFFLLALLLPTVSQTDLLSLFYSLPSVCLFLTSLLLLFLLLLPVVQTPLSCFYCLLSMDGCFISPAEQINFMLVFHHRESPGTLVCICPVVLIPKFWNARSHSAVFENQTGAPKCSLRSFHSQWRSLVFQECCLHLLSIAGTAGCGVIGFMAELGALCRLFYRAYRLCF